MLLATACKIILFLILPQMMLPKKLKFFVKDFELDDKNDQRMGCDSQTYDSRYAFL
jgi:hypothetical protein